MLFKGLLLLLAGLTSWQMAGEERSLTEAGCQSSRVTSASTS